MMGRPAILDSLAPLLACSNRTQDCVLAVIIDVEGPSYRPVGAMMTVLRDGLLTVGSLSSGCVEADIKLHAQDCLNSGVAKVLRYGRGSPYRDIVLPCGGGLQIILIPNPNREIIDQLLKTVQKERQTCSYEINCRTGAISMGKGSEIRDAVFRGEILPEIKFLIFGKGPEVTTFAALLQTANYQTTLLSPDTTTLEEAKQIGCQTFELEQPKFPDDIHPDPRTAIILFFHDHDWEPPILYDALLTSAFYIGAQGSKRTRDNRIIELRDLGISEHNLERLHGPIGLINSARDPRTLAISVLAEVISLA
ncbi:XdhC family protein [Pacificibacter marinus]|uniref:XdhC family protein n=1 Tax=Pacificibacter marinus TaxID=658057 RepID=UPI001C079A1F|nr:XdhC family protein [Pacificibacter marinus]MBU2867421.1 XdhC family protein [Pacificibacter marinus]